MDLAVACNVHSLKSACCDGKHCFTFILYSLMYLFFFTDNLFNRYTEVNKAIGTDSDGDEARGEIVAEITTSFMVLLAIYFPSVTGDLIFCSTTF